MADRNVDGSAVGALEVLVEGCADEKGARRVDVLASGVGEWEASLDGKAEGAGRLFDGIAEAVDDGLLTGDTDGTADGLSEEAAEGLCEGFFVARVRLSFCGFDEVDLEEMDGDTDSGLLDGCPDGSSDGHAVGPPEGALEGLLVGDFEEERAIGGTENRVSEELTDGL